MAEAREHPNLFNADEAAAYLHLDTTVTLDTLRDKKLLTGYPVGKRYMYWRDDLDVCALKMVGRTQEAERQQAQQGNLKLRYGGA